MTERQVIWNVRDGKVQSVEEIVAVGNMATVKDFRGIRGASRGLKLIVWGDDHSNPHVEARWGNRVLAKYHIYPNLSPPKDEDNYLTKEEKALVEAWLGQENNVKLARKKWYEVHQNNPAANNPFDAEGNIVK